MKSKATSRFQPRPGINFTTTKFFAPPCGASSTITTPLNHPNAQRDPAHLQLTSTRLIKTQNQIYNLIVTPMLGLSPVRRGLVRAWRGPPPSNAECDGRPDAWGEASRVLRWSFVPSCSPVASGRDGRGVGGEGRRALPHRHALDQPSINAVPSRHRMQHGCRGKPCGTSCESRVEWSAW